MQPEQIDLPFLEMLYLLVCLYIAKCLDNNITLSTYNSEGIFFRTEQMNQ